MPVALKAAIWGAVIFGSITIVLVAADHFIGEQSGDFWVDTIFGLLLIVGTPTLAVKHIIGLDRASADSFASSSTFGVIVNALPGAMIFACAATVWRFIKKIEYDE